MRWKAQTREFVQVKAVRKSVAFLFARLAVIATNQISRFRGRVAAVFDFLSRMISRSFLWYISFFFLFLYITSVCRPIVETWDPDPIRPPNGPSRHLYFVSSRLASDFWRNKSAINHAIFCFHFSLLCLVLDHELKGPVTYRGYSYCGYH